MPRLALAVFGSALLSAGCFLFPSNDNQSAGSFDTHPIRVDSVGYLPDRAKMATVVAPGGTSFDVHSADGMVAWSGPLTGPVSDITTGDDLWVADFSAVTQPGEYYLEVSGVGQSAHFQIAPDAFNEAYVKSMLGLYGQRCGSGVSITLAKRTWSHKECHASDAYLHYWTGADTIRPTIGGWHDAGDYGKYITNGAFSAGMLLRTWEQFQTSLAPIALAIPEHGGPIPDFLAEVKWELDWLLTTQGDDGGVVHKVTALNFEGFVTPDADGSKRYYTGVGTNATADFAAVMAQASRLYRPYDAAFADRTLAAAQRSYAYLAANPGRIFPDTTDFHTGGYTDSSDADERLWAAAELWETTGDAAALADFETRVGPRGVDGNFDWANVGNLGIFTYVLSQRDGRDPTTLDRMSMAVIASANGIATVSKTNGYGRGINNFWWGSNGAVARTAMNLMVANALSPDPKYLDAVLSQLDHLLGRNAYDRSQVTNIGYHPPLFPHHRPSVAIVGDPWPGLLVGGQDSATDADWKDSSGFANLNEVAINWNGALIYALAAVLH